MEDIEDPHLQDKIAKIRETLKKLGSSITDEVTPK